ncbi:MAG: endonuclease III [Gemmatimonadetes bacterium]|nr:endonuclease III [Gemmatimonadota bacterium]
MPRETKKARAARAALVYDLLAEEYPNAHCELDYANAYQLAVATILSAQTTDVRVNIVTPILFKRYPTAVALANAQQEDVEGIIRSTGFFRNKAKNIIGFARGVMAEHGGEVPCTLAELAALPGVGRKTANVILGNAFGIAEGVVVDTHVKRLSARLGFTRYEDPVKVEEELMTIFPRERWTMLSHLLIWHGRRVCDARKPRCDECTVSRLCPASMV